MRRYALEQKLKSFAAFLIILILLPYIVSVFAGGADLAGGESGSSFYVKVRVPAEEEADEVREVEWTEYLAGILAMEVEPEYPEEAMKAQAVVIRTQVYRSLTESEDGILTGEYLSRDELQEQWDSEEFPRNYEKYIRAVEQTDDTVLMYGDTYAWTPFHQSSNGMTRSAAEVMGTEDYPYIALRDCPLDKEADNEIQVFSFTCSEIQTLCRDFLVAEENDEAAEKGYSAGDFEILSCDSAGYVSELRIGNTVCTGDQFRDALSLPSSAFSIGAADGEEEKAVTVTTTGKGHGLGMSLWTAGKMAEDGNSFEEILTFFFEGTEMRTDIQETTLAVGEGDISRRSGQGILPGRMSLHK